MRNTLLITLLLALLVPVAPAAAQDASFHDRGCFDDPAGDVPHPAGDLVTFCANVGDSVQDAQGNFGGEPKVVLFVWDLAEPADPGDDPAWTEDGTRAVAEVSADGTAYEVVVTRGPTNLVVTVTPPTGGAACRPGGIVGGTGNLIAQAELACFGNAGTLTTVARMEYQPSAGAEVAVDRAPDSGANPPLTDAGPPANQCGLPGEDDDGQVNIVRLRCGGSTTDPVMQAVATSEFLFDPFQASWAVIARDDDFADALAGSALGFGLGPILFTPSPASAPPGTDPGQLADATRRELLRVLPRGSTVYLLGGVDALHPGLEQQLVDLGYVPQRFAGDSRFATARLIAREVRQIVTDYVAFNPTLLIDTNSVLVVNGRNWPDAIAAGQIAAWWGMPILLVERDLLHPETLAALQELQPDFINTIGGSAVVATEVLHAMRPLADGRAGVEPFCFADNQPIFSCRFAGDDRIVTATGAGELQRKFLDRFPRPQAPGDAVYGVAINMRSEPDAWAYAMAASAVSGRLGGALFIPAEGEAGDQMRFEVESWLCAFLPDLRHVLLAGDVDVLADSFGLAVRQQITSDCA